MTDHHIALLRAFRKAREDNDEKEFFSHLAHDAEIITPKGTFKGHHEIKKWWDEKSDLPEWEDHLDHVEGGHFRRKGHVKKGPVHLNIVQDIWIEHGKIHKVHIHAA